MIKLYKNFWFFCNKLKNSKFGTYYLYVSEQNIEVVQFHPLTLGSDNSENIVRFKKWRQNCKSFFYSKNYITFKTTQIYFKKYFFSKELRIIFYIKYKNFFLACCILSCQLIFFVICLTWFNNGVISRLKLFSLNIKKPNL